MVKFQGKDWSLLVARNMSFFHDALDRWGTQFALPKYGLISLTNLAIAKDGNQSFVFDEQESSQQFAKNLESVCQSAAKLEQLEKKYLEFGNNLLKASDNLEREISLENFIDYIESYKDLAGGLGITARIGKHITPLLKTLSINSFPDYSNKKIDLLISEITYPTEHTPLLMSQVSLLSLGQELQKNNISVGDINKYPDIYEKFKSHYKTYSVIPVNFNEDPWTEKEILEQLQKIMNKNCALEKKNISENHTNKIKIRDAKLVGLSPQIKQIAHSLQVGTYLNEYRKFIICRANLAYRPIFKLVAQKYQLANWRECYKLTPDEIINLYFNEDKGILDILPQRKWAGIISDTKLKYRVMSDEEIQPFVDEIQNKKIKEEVIGNKNEIVGTVANQGVVRGVAKIILGSQDFSKFNDGDIIVASMTSVDYIPIMERASALITNEGGILCHASIVSREMNKPCIIDTKIATKVFKDGDLIEVDADNGIIRLVIE